MKELEYLMTGNCLDDPKEEFTGGELPEEDDEEENP